MDVDLERAAKIAALNDAFRQQGYKYMLTRGVHALNDVQKVVEEVRTFKDFSEDNDPYQEHDFGSFTCEGEKIFWKIDYYDVVSNYFSDPLSEDCIRILTVMLASEY